MWVSQNIGKRSYRWIRQPTKKRPTTVDRATARAAGKFKENLVKGRRRKQVDRRQEVLDEMECRKQGYNDCAEQRAEEEMLAKIMGGRKKRF